MIKITLLFLISLSILSANMKELKVQLRWKHQFQFAGYYMALHKGYYKDAGFDVSLLEGASDINVVHQVLSKKADFGVSNSSLVIDYLNGLDVVMLGAIFQHSPNILLAKKEYKSPVDLAKGGKIALMGGDQDVELKAMFLREGIDLAKVNFVAKEKHLEDLLENKVIAINAYTSNEPFLLSQKKIEFSVLEPRAYGLDFYGDTLFTSTTLYEENKATVSDFRKATFKGWEYALANIDETVEIIMKHYNTQNKSKEHLVYEAQVLKNLISPELIQIGHSNPGRWSHIVEVYKQFGLVNLTRTLDDFFYVETEEVDLTWFYFYFLASSLAIFIVAFIAYYIHRINQKLTKSEKRHKILFQNSASAGIVWKKGFILTDWNEQATRLFGWSSNEVIGKNFMDFLIPEFEKKDVLNNLSSISNDSNLYIFTNTNLLKNGSIITCEWHNTILYSCDNTGNFEVVSLAIDVTQRKKEEETLKQQANYDSLTNLPNRHFFKNILEKTYALHKRNNSIFGLAFIDLDGFKVINDTYGHHAGDVLLKEISMRFQSVLRQEDTVARLGGDEFALIFNMKTIDDDYVNIIDRILDSASKPVIYSNNVQLQVSASIGVSFFYSKNKIDINELINQADKAMYEAKKAGKNRFCIYELE